MAASLLGFTGIAQPAEPDPELFSLPAEWDSVLSLQLGGGYKDNVFLSHADPQGSAFLTSSAEVMLMRLSPTGPQFTAFANADASHYPATTPAHEEYTVFAQAQVEQDLNEKLTAWLAAEYAYQDQFLDVAFLDASVAAAGVTVLATAVRGHTLSLRPGASLDLSSQWSLALEAPMTRQFYDAPLDDYWRAGSKLTLGYSYGRSSQLSLSYEPAWRLYDSDPALTSTGDPIPGTRRERFQQEATMTWRQHWDEAKRWRTTTKLGGRLSQENAGGYADHALLSASAQLRYRARPWELCAEGRVRRFAYDSQPFSPEDPSPRRRTEWSATLRVERQFGQHLTVAASYEHEETLSNDVWETYTVNTVSGSLQWAF
jgi:hypothetical protein